MPPTWVAAVALVLAVAVIAYRPAWRITRTGITIVHEAGHAAVALLVGRRLKSIRLHNDTSGLTLSSGRPTGPGMVATLAAGYLTPSILGLVATWLVASRRITLALAGIVLLLVAVLVMTRNLYGLLSVAVLIAAGVFVLGYGTPTLQSLVAWIASWFLLLGGVRPVWELQRQRAGTGALTSDPDQLAAITHVPAALWVVLFGLVNLGALLIGGRWLLATTTWPG